MRRQEQSRGIRVVVESARTHGNSVQPWDTSGQRNVQSEEQ